MFTHLNRTALISASSLFLFACNNNLPANDAQTYDRIELQASSVEWVNNDELEAQIFIEKNATNPKTLTQQINPLVAAALEKAKAYPDVKLSTAGQRSSPNYDYRTNKITSWSMRSELRLQSTNFEAASELIGALQDIGLEVADISFKVSDDQRQKVENQMITQVTESFKERAEVVKKSWGATDYRLVNLTIKSNTNSDESTPYGNQVYATMEQDASAASAPIAAGDQRIEMVAQGAVELTK